MCAFVPIKMLRHFAHLPEDVFDGCQHVQILGSSIHSTFEGWRSYQAGDFAFKVVIIFCYARSHHGTASCRRVEKCHGLILFETSIEKQQKTCLEKIMFMIIMSKLIN